MCISFGRRLVTLPIVAPQTPQNKRRPSSDDANSRKASLPVIHSNRSSGTSTHVAKLLPVALRHAEQWQLTTLRGSPSNAYRTAPHKHDPS